MKNKILIATINDDHRFLLTMLFTDAGFIVDAPEDLALCSVLVEQNEYFKVILDYDYRSKKNRLFCSYLERTHKFNKSVLIQAISNDDITSKVYEQGGRVVNKPYDTDYLVNVVREMRI